ncbi:MULTISPECIES: site-specific integrase [Bacillus amyloliquefaciens group]|nr:MULTISPECIES: site-specific integrase [Bacillus amyloliquefaciens group]AGF26870.1 integrase-recombinase protein [Bacillus amyloliquefaciens IT-45]AMP31017.1 integrase [Bacillus amyloliquefaciens]ERK83415.1 DNA integrase [Bacillus amyloliquefaciens UASWS BA1]MBH5314326.1 site-specific integrase [Bacillus velezensis]MDQ1917350.1 site-specific integrase [Bacillus velezensis]
MASYRKRGDNWEYRITYYDPITNKRREKTKKGFRTKKEAMVAAAQAEINIDQDFFEKDDNIRLASYLDKWFEDYKPTVKESSWKTRHDSLIILKKHLGAYKLKSVNEKIYRNFLNDIAPQYAKNTLIGVHHVIKMVMDQAVKDSYFRYNPIKEVKIPKTTKDTSSKQVDEDLADIKFWEKEEITAYLNAVKRKGRPQDLAMFLLLVYSGLRIGEAVALKWDKIDFEESIIRVRFTLFQKNGLRGKYKMMPPKTQSSIRNVPVPPQVINQLRVLKHVQERIKEEKRGNYVDEDFVFADHTGQPEPARNFNYRMATYIKKAGVKKITPHNLRHTYTALMIDAGIDIKEAQKRLGHSSAKTTLDIYSHIMKDKKTASIVQFNAMANEIF